MSRSYLSFLLISFSFLLIIFSCKRDAPMGDMAIIEVDFLMNEQDLEKFGLEFTAQEFERDINDPNKVLTVKVGEPVKFKDISEGSENISKRRWQLNEGEWVQAETGKEFDIPEFTYVFEDPGFHKITLMVGEANYASKMVKVVSEEYVAADPPLKTIEVDPNEPAGNESTSNQASTTSRPEPVSPTPRTTPSQTTRTTPTPPAEPVKMTSINFVAPTEVIVGQTFEIKDISAPASAVSLRVWDLGDGTTQRTKGSTYRYFYLTEGEKIITLCLNNTDQCTTKRINVKPKPEAKKEVVTNTPPRQTTPAEKPKAPAISKVEFTMPSTAVVGSSVDILDRSQPGSAITKRTWSFGDGTPDLNTGKDAISHVFNKAGTFKVSVCLNDSKEFCQTQEITITEKPEVKAVVAETAKPAASTGGFDYSSYEGNRQGSVGMVSAQKCDAQTFKYFEGTATMVFTPKQALELEEARVYTNSNGKLDFVLTNSKGVEEGSVRNVQVNPGPSVVYLTDLAVIMIPGEKYTLTITASPGLKLENSAPCNPNPRTSEVVGVNYNGNFVLYDLRFYY